MYIIFSKFLNCEPDKQERILNAAIKEFAQKGFEKASTNEIVKDANISKGLLFHYFNNKKDLYFFLYDYSLNIFMNDFFGKIDLKEKDVFHRLRQMATLKLELIQKYPEMFKFILVANLEEAAEVKNELGQRNRNTLTQSYQKIFDEINVSLFREGIDIQEAIQILIWTIEGFSNREAEKARGLHSKEIDYDQALGEMDHYLELLKRCFYK